MGLLIMEPGIFSTDLSYQESFIMNNQRFARIASFVALAGAFWTATADAGMMAYQATSAGGNAPTAATFTTGTGTLFISIINNDVNPGDVGENLTALSVQLSPVTTTAPANLVSSSGLERTVDG